MVITGLTRNQFALTRTRVRIPLSPPNKKPLLSTKAKEVSLVFLVKTPMSFYNFAPQRKQSVSHQKVLDLKSTAMNSCETLENIVNL